MKTDSNWLVSVHPLTWLLAAASFLTGQFISFFILILLVIIHECGHAAAAFWFKWKVKSITLLPFGGKLEVEGILDRPLGEEVVVVLSGPLQHVWLGAAGFFFLQDWSYYTEFMQLNFQLLCFNLLPVWPLDGGRLMFLLLAKISPFRQAVKQSLIISMAGLLLSLWASIFLFLFNLQLMIVLLYVFTACLVQWRHRHMLERQFWLERLNKHAPNKGVPRMITVQKQSPISHILHSLKKGQRDVIIIKDYADTVGMVPDLSCIEHYFKNGLITQPVSFLLQK
ncbi:M50 family metallopeptidase [Jeotgalibacillus proteolyticus]|uniref:Peptidase M50 domain-containing protein n=1 Tax=Jeotgalibacillus proteolyticus TaxID=2082395 RepID=A0A2S5GEU1_9BACL|nr:M50 family metallopeptidase [Jeotgalibacillus proteolyticus]PPA71540.1 hypothetical protein C4B60_05625 [Jeotgalibacillus proteolyticus]